MSELCGNSFNFGKYNYLTFFFPIYVGFFDVERKRNVTKFAILEKVARILRILSRGPKNTGILGKGAKNQFTKTKNTVFMIT